MGESVTGDEHKPATIKVSRTVKQQIRPFLDANPWLGLIYEKDLVDLALWQFMQVHGLHRFLQERTGPPRHCDECGRDVWIVPFGNPGTLVLRELGHRAECPNEYANQGISRHWIPERGYPVTKEERKDFEETVGDWDWQVLAIEESVHHAKRQHEVAKGIQNGTISGSYHLGAPYGSGDYKPKYTKKARPSKENKTHGLPGSMGLD